MIPYFFLLPLLVTHAIPILNKTEKAFSGLNRERTAVQICLEIFFNSSYSIELVTSFITTGSYCPSFNICSAFKLCLPLHSNKNKRVSFRTAFCC